MWLLLLEALAALALLLFAVWWTMWPRRREADRSGEAAAPAPVAAAEEGPPQAGQAAPGDDRAERS